MSIRWSSTEVINQVEAARQAFEPARDHIFAAHQALKKVADIPKLPDYMKSRISTSIYDLAAIEGRFDQRLDAILGDIPNYEVPRRDEKKSRRYYDPDKIPYHMLTDEERDAKYKRPAPVHQVEEEEEAPEPRPDCRTVFYCSKCANHDPEEDDCIDPTMGFIAKGEEKVEVPKISEVIPPVLQEVENQLNDSGVARQSSLF